MLRRLDNRVGHYALLMLVWAVLCLPNLGGPSLWDIDEGNNAQAAREMYESGNVIVPTFNYKLRVDKPVLLYWLQASAYHVCGVNEFAARLPSALAALLAALVTYELGRRLFGQSAGLLAGLILASSVAFCGAAHFANPDALLNLCTVLTLWCFWNHYSRERGGWWLLGCGAASGLGMLAKGPVGLLLPMTVTMVFLLWRRELRRLWDLRLLGASVLFLLVALPWYIWVGLETKGEWLIGFFWKHNVQRAVGAMENHGGPFYYYVLVLIAGLTPWSIFLGPTAWHCAGRPQKGVLPPSRKKGIRPRLRVRRVAVPAVLAGGLVRVLHRGADETTQLHSAGVSSRGSADGGIPRRLAARPGRAAGLGDAHEPDLSGADGRRREPGAVDRRRCDPRESRYEAGVCLDWRRVPG